MDWLHASAPTVAKEALGEAALFRALDDDFAATIRSRTCPDWGARFRAHCPVASATPTDYCLREIEIGERAHVLAGIHFYGSDVRKPFVGVYAQSRDLSVTETAAAAARLGDAFANFNPLASWWWSKDSVLDVESSSMGVHPDQRFLLGSIRDIVQRPLSRSDIDCVLRKDQHGTSYDAYTRIVADFIEQNPFWAGRIERTEREDYLECAAVGGVCVVERQGAIGGVFAARPGAIRGIPGWEVVDAILASGLRGRGWAPVLQRMFLEQLDTTVQPLIIGTIDAANTPSLRTALRVGRTDGGGWYFASDPRQPWRIN
jgi:hypothetical protein